MGLIKYLSHYVSRRVLDQIYKLYMRPHSDYGDIIYHRYDPDMQSTLSAKSSWSACTVLRIFYPRPVSKALTKV